MKLVKKEKLGVSMAGSDLHLSKIGAFQIIEDAITEFMGDINIDTVTLMQTYNAFWVMAKTRVKFLKQLSWLDEYTITAFISSISLAKMYEDIKVCDKDGDVIFYARVELCALDLGTQRIRKITTVGVNETMLSTEGVEEITFGKFLNFDLPLVEQVKIRSTNIDRLHHTNNVEYIRFILNTYSVEELETKNIKEMEIVYSGQSYENNTLDILKASNKDNDLIVLQMNGKPIIKCEIVF